MKASVEKLRELVQPIIDDYGAELVDLEVKGKGDRKLLRIFVDIAGGVTVDDCVHLTKKLMNLSSLNATLGRNYRLEVSSPGLDRPLKTKRDFERHLGEEVTIDYTISGRTTRIEGKILNTSDDLVTIRNAESENHIPLNSIMRAKLKLKW